MHREWGWDGREPREDDAECGKSCGLCGMSQHGLRVLWDVTLHSFVLSLVPLDDSP